MYLHFTIFFPVFSDMAKSIYILAKYVFTQKKRDNSLFGYYLAFLQQITCIILHQPQMNFLCWIFPLYRDNFLPFSPHSSIQFHALAPVL